MAFNRVLVCLTVLLAVAHTVPVPDTHALHEHRETLHPRWTKRDRIEGHKLLPMRIGLAQSNLDDVHSHLMDVSNPDSPKYGQHWTQEQVIDAFKPSVTTEDAVRQWLVDNGIPAKRISHSGNKGWFAFYATTEEAERLLHTEYHEYYDSISDVVMPACEMYHVPHHIQEHIDYITPGIKLLAPVEDHLSQRDRANFHAWEDSFSASYRPLVEHSIRKGEAARGKMSTNVSDTSTCDIAITPACVAALYKIPATNGTAHPNNSLGIFESELQFYTQLDLDSAFTNLTGGAIPNGTHPIAANIDGGQQATTDLYEAGPEVILDFILAYPIVYPQTITNYQTDDFITQAMQNDTYVSGFNTFLDALDGSYCTLAAYGEKGNDPNLDPVYPDGDIGGYAGPLMCGVYKPAHVISFSYGGQEVDVPINYQKRQCLEYAKLGLQGVSFLFASGDSGVSNYPAPYGSDGKTGCLGKDLNVFNPTWPVNCPYVTAVGATKVYAGKTVNEPESAVYDPAGSNYAVNYSSGGGFSNIYAIPDYQKSAVHTFFTNHTPPYKYYSALASNTTDLKKHVNITHLAGNTGGIYNRLGRGIPDVAANGDNIAVFQGGNFSLSGGTSAACPIFAAVVNRLNEARLNANKKSLGFLNPSLYKNPSMLNDITNGSNPGCGTKGFEAVKGWDPATGLGTPNFPKMLEYFMSLP